MSARRTRRSVLTSAVSLSLAGLQADSIAAIRQAAANAGQPSTPPTSCVFVFLFGGPSHLDLWDMKPAAPREIRGEFLPVSTSVPGIFLSEHLPRLTQQMHRFSLIRSMTHRMPVHGPACSELYSGRPYFGAPVTDQARPEDWPSIASIVQRFTPGTGPLPASVVVPWYTQFVGQDRRIAGQTGGRMGEQFNPLLLSGNPTDADFHMRGVQLPDDVDVDRFRARRDLRDSLAPFGLQHAQSTIQTRLTETNYQSAAALVENARSVGAFDLSHESQQQRQKYGMTRFGQSLLVARRLAEAQVPLITVNWDDDHKDDKVSPHWDTHVDNFPKLKDRLCPPFDQALSAFFIDMDERGLLDTTLVCVVGEFGRTPKIGVVTQNGMTEKTGRDHWPHAFTAVVAGGGIRGGQVFGATTSTGGYVADQPVTPADLAATIFEHLGIDPSLEYDDHFLQTTQRLTIGRSILADLS